MSPALIGDLERLGTAHAIVSLTDPGRGVDRPARIVAARAGLQGLAPHVVLRRGYTNVPAVAVDLTPRGLELLEARAASVASITRDEATRPELAESVPLLHASAAHAAGFTGAGVLVGIVDTGADATHPDLAGHVVAQHCFTHGACARGVADGPDEGDTAFDDVGHGTNVTAIVLSQGHVGSIGFAPGADAVVVRALGRGGGYVSDWVAALDWFIEHHEDVPVRIVNLSLGTDTTYDGECDADQPAVAAAIGELTALGVVVVAASGNNGSASGLTSPACNAGVLSVGATYDATWPRFPASEASYAGVFGEGFAGCHDAPAGVGAVACFTNSSPRLSVLAPGAVIAAAAPTDLVPSGLAASVGTSQASATAAGVIAMVLEARPSLGPADVAAVLAASGKAVIDPKNGLSFPLIDAQRAVGLAQCFEVADGVACDDTEPCTSDDACSGGSCTGARVTDGLACDDGDACTLGETCSAGACAASSTVGCPIGAACDEPPSCRIGDGVCISYPTFDGAPCDDGNACTNGDACVAGVCHGEPRSCGPAPACLVEAGCVAGACSEAPAPDGAHCPGGECSNGKCVPTITLDPNNGGSDAPDSGCSCGTTPSGRSGRGELFVLLPLVASLRRSRRRTLCWSSRRASRA